MSKDITTKSFLINLFLIIIFLISLRTYLSLTIPPQIVGDSPEYISIIKNILRGKEFSELDPIDNKIKPYARRPPVFFYVASLTNFFKTPEHNIMLINSVSLILIVLLSIYIPFLITENKMISTLSGWLTAINVNLIYNSLLVMSDTFFTAITMMFSVFAILSFKTQKKYLFILSGLFLAISVLTRTVLKFYWLFFTLLIIYSLIKFQLNKRLKYLTLFLIGYLLLITSYHIRNYYKIGSLSIESYQGASAIWSIMPLVKTTDYNFLIKKDISYEKILEILKKYDYPNIAEYEVRKSCNLKLTEYSRKLINITIYTILKNPFQYLKIFIKNFINNITSSSAYLAIIDLIKPGYYKNQHNIMLNLIKSNIGINEFKYIIPNLFFRLINLILFILSIIGIIISFNKINKNYSLFLISILSYTILITSLSSSYDRYRLPIEFIINFYLAYFIYNFKDFKNKLKNHRNFLKA